MKEYLYSAFKEAENKIPQLKEIPISFDIPKLIEHGDLSSNVAMLLTKTLKNPRAIAQEIIDSLDIEESIIAKTEIAGPGFINFSSRQLMFLKLFGKFLIKRKFWKID